jgi:hypothetical protein
MFEPSYQLSKAGVIFPDLQPEGLHQGMLDLGGLQGDRTALMSALDEVNCRDGRGRNSVQAAEHRETVAGVCARRARPSYATSWTELTVARTSLADRPRREIVRWHLRDDEETR